MLTTNERYLEIVKSNVRPKITPHIKVSGEDVKLSYSSKTTKVKIYIYKK